ncbi:MAG: hypothetical protein WAQ05_15615, partial [Rubrivivax sp.]
MTSILRRSIGLAAMFSVLWPAMAAAPTTEMGPRLKRAVAAAADTGTGRVIVKYRSGSTLMRALAAHDAGPQHAAAMGTRLGLAMQDGR